MAKRIKCQANLYTDSNFTQLAATFPMYFNICVGNTATVSFQNIGTNKTFFTSRLEAGESDFLGGIFYTQTDPASSKIPSEWFPACVTTITNEWDQSCHLEYVFNNGYKMRLDATIGEGGGRKWHFYNNNMAEIGYVGQWGLFYPVMGSSGRPRYVCLVVNNLDGDGNMPDAVNGAYYSINGQYGSAMWGGIDSITSADMAVYRNFFNNIEAYYPSTDPFAPEGPSEPGGGGGTFDGTSDSNPIPSDPTISATDTGFMTAFATNLAGIQSLATSLWSDIFSAIQPGGTLEGTVEALKNIVASPYDAILGCHIIPVAVAVGASKNVKLYGVLPSTVSLPVAASQWVHKDCGTLTIEPFDGSYLDYAPYSKVTSLYLPFVGVVSVDIDIIMNTTIGVYYKIDIISGQCIAFITKNGDVYFQYQGQCAVPLPVTSVDWSTTVSAGLGIVGSIGSIAGSAVGGALGGGGAAGALAGAVKGTIGEAGSIAQNVMNSKPDIKSGSGVGGSAALMGCKNPYLIIERPRKSTPIIKGLSQNHWTGYPSNIAARIGSLEGYTEVSRVFVNRTNATAAEKQEIEKLLNEGVYL